MSELIEKVEELVGSRIRTYLHGTDSVSHSPSDRLEIRRSIESIYQASGFERPIVIWCESPFQLSAATLLSNLLLSGDYIVLDRLKKLIARFGQDRYVIRLMNVIERDIDVSSIQPFQLGNTIANVLLARMSRIAPRYRQMLRYDESADGDSGKARFMNAALEMEAVWLSLDRSAPSRVANNFLSDLRKLQTAMPIPSSMDDYFQGNMDAWGPWSLRNNRFFRIDDDSESADWLTLVVSQSINEAAGFANEELKHWGALMQHGFCYKFFKKVCFVCLPPSCLSVDEFARPHSETGPAVEFADGSCIYAFHGTPVPERVIKGRKQISPLTIDLEPNAELRRIMLEMYGMENYLRRSKARKIHQDEFGVLYRKHFFGDEPLVVVEVTNSTPEPDGSRRRYILRVPPDIVTAREAVAWTFGMRESEYRPSAES